MVFARSMWLLGLIYFLGLGLVFGLNFGESLKVPFSVNDVLPALPRQISWPVLNNLHSAVDLLPSLVGSVSPNNGSIEWKGAFFFDNEARLEFTGGDRGLGGGVLHLKNFDFVLMTKNSKDTNATMLRCYPYVTGTSVIGIKFKDGILMAADMGGSYGSTLRYKSVERLKSVGKHSPWCKWRNK